MKKSFILFVILGITSFIKSQTVNIPDANFKAYLVGKTTINTNGDTEIQVSEAENFTGVIDCNWRNIINLTGIDKFVKISELYCYGNKLTNLDVSKNTALIYLDCHINQLTSLDLSKNTALTYLDASENYLTSLDLNNNIALTYLDASENYLTNLDVSKNIYLQTLRCVDGQLTDLDVSKNTALITLNCFRNQLTTLDVSKNIALKSLYCHGNHQLISLDISKNTVLQSLYCGENHLTSINLKNGNNGALLYMSASPNPNLTCINVDNITNSNSYAGWEKPATANYNTNCLLFTTEIEKLLIRIYPNPAKNILNFSQEVSNIRITELSGKISKQVSNTEKSINIAKLAKGTYIITATTKTGEVINKKFIKE